MAGVCGSDRHGIPVTLPQYSTTIGALLGQVNMQEIGVFVVSAPSGTGKTTLNRMLTKKYPNVEISVSLTTRAIRDGERDGFDYHFVNQREFTKHVDAGEMLEWAKVHDHYYGTSLIEIRRIQELGHIPLLEIDVQGWSQARQKLRKAIAVFVLPPSVETLWERLTGRGTDSEQVRWRRLQNARQEIAESTQYQHFIVNDSLDQAFRELESILIDGAAPRLSYSEGCQWSRKLLDDFEKSAFIKELRQRFGERQ